MGPTRDQQVEALFPLSSIRAFSCEVDASLIPQLRPEELPPIEPMAAARRAEFATARACARAALADLGVDAGIPRRDGGAPEWPTGMAGSISHTRGFCVAVAATGGISVGIDVEEVARMKLAVERRILVDAERRELHNLGPALRRRQVASIFASKEAFYKAHYEVEPRYLGFDAVEVDITDGRVSFLPSSGAVSPELLLRTSGRLLVDRGRVFAGVTIDATDR